MKDFGYICLLFPWDPNAVEFVHTLCTIIKIHQPKQANICEAQV